MRYIVTGNEYSTYCKIKLFGVFGIYLKPIIRDFRVKNQIPTIKDIFAYNLFWTFDDIFLIQNIYSCTYLKLLMSALIISILKPYTEDAIV